MKKNLIYMAALAVIVAACSKEDDIFVTTPENNNVPGEVKMIIETITATNGDAPTRAAIADADGAFTWTAGDNIAVHVSNGTTHKYVSTADEGASGADQSAAEASFTVAYEEGYSRDAFAVFPASIVATDAANYGQSGSTLDVILPASYTLDEVSGTTTPCPMIAENTGDSWTFKQLCGLLRLTVKSIPNDATGMVIQFPGKKVNGSFSVTDPSSTTPTIATSAPATGEDKITVTFAAGTTEATVNLPLPAGDYEDVYITPVGSATKVAALRHIKAGGYTAARARAKKLTTTMVAFSVSATKKVIFAPGNLQATYNASAQTWTWKFAAHQYDIIGNGPGNTSVNGNGTLSSTGTVDLFSFSIDDDYGIKNSGNNDCFNGSFKDWGNNIIGGYAENYWRTLSSEEWQYVVGEGTYRNTNSKVANVQNAMCTKATVNGIRGFILFPDDYDYDSGTQIEGVTWSASHIGYTDMGTPSSKTGWGASISSIQAWEPLEAAGCVFLPLAGIRLQYVLLYIEGGYSQSDNPSGYYASSTTAPDQNGTLTYYCLRFNNAGYDPNNWNFRKYGASVRLVHEFSDNEQITDNKQTYTSKEW